MLTGWQAQITASAFNWLGQYASIPMQNLSFLCQQWLRPSPVLIVPTHKGLA